MRHDNDLHKAANWSERKERWLQDALWASVFITLLAVLETLVNAV